MTLGSASVGDPERFLALADLAHGLDALAAAPASGGRLTLIVRRRDAGRREALSRVRLTAEGGVTGDAWSERTPDPAGQITVMQADVAALIANGQPLELFGDNLFVDLDLSTPNVPPGSRVRIGAVTLEVTPKPHDGCRKFRGRFGGDALRFVAHPDRRHRNLRGIYMRVVEAGEVAVGDVVEVIFRAFHTSSHGQRRDQSRVTKG